MSVERQALIKTVKLFVSAIVTSAVALFVFTSIPTDVALLLFMLAMVGYLGYVYYGITLNQLKYKEKLQEMVDQK